MTYFGPKRNKDMGFYVFMFLCIQFETKLLHMTKPIFKLGDLSLAVRPEVLSRFLVVFGESPWDPSGIEVVEETP